MKTLTIEIALTIPDNEAYTALTTLQRLGLAIADVRRADVWRFEVDESHADAFPGRVRTLETIYNPNKHELRMRENDRPGPGEAWIDEPGHGVLQAPVRISGRELAGVRRATRYTAWRLRTSDGEPACAEIVERALNLLFCNSAFQRATI